MVRFIFWLIIGFIVAKIFGAVLQAARSIFLGGRPRRPDIGSTGQSRHNHRIEDIDYEEIDDKKQ